MISWLLLYTYLCGVSRHNDSKKRIRAEKSASAHNFADFSLAQGQCLVFRPCLSRFNGLPYIRTVLKLENLIWKCLSWKKSSLTKNYTFYIDCKYCGVERIPQVSVLKISHIQEIQRFNIINLSFPVLGIQIKGTVAWEGVFGLFSPYSRCKESLKLLFCSNF